MAGNESSHACVFFVWILVGMDEMGFAGGIEQSRGKIIDYDKVLYYSEFSSLFEERECSFIHQSSKFWPQFLLQ